MSTYVNKPMSLIERKKQQWAKEREELAKISGYWRQPPENQNFERPFERNRYASKFSMVHEYEKNDSKDGTRRSSLPPLYKNQYNSNDRYEREKEHGGETSGYGSDNTPEYSNVQWNQSGYESSSSRDDRPKWGDKGVGVGKFWQPKEESTEKVASEPPNWVKRGLQDGEIIVSNQSPAESPEQAYEDQDRPYTTGSGSSNNRSYIRGQNIPLDSLELAERERKRQIALAHQEAVRQQLEERERKRREEREKRIREEREEELRIEREQEVERRRQELEQKILKEKQERDRKRKEAIQEALEIAQKEAQLAKMKQKMQKHMNNIIDMNMSENVVEKEKLTDIEETSMLIKNYECHKTDNQVEEKLTNCDNEKSVSEISPPQESSNIDPIIENKSKVINTSSEDSENNSLSPRSAYNNLKNNITNSNSSNIMKTPLSTPRPEYQALIFQSPLEILQSIPYAVLVPNFNASTSTIAVPIMQSEQSTCTTRTENRILTPTQYRNRNIRTCDSSTQTEYSDFRNETDSREKYIKEKISNIELTYDNRSSRKDRRSRNEDRRNENVEERPKWGANRPPTRYLKQSEKDLLYQRRKLRQKMREPKNYDDKNSSDESQVGTPRSYRKKGYVEKRHSRALWRKNDQIFQRNIRMYQTEVVPLEFDKDHMYYRPSREHECCCRCMCDKNNVKVDILKIEHTSPRENIQYKAELIERSDRLPDCITNENNSDIIDKLTSLHNGLLLKQEQWKNSPRTPSLSSLNKSNDN